MIHRFEETSEPHYALVLLMVCMACLIGISIAFLVFVSLHGGM